MLDTSDDLIMPFLYVPCANLRQADRAAAGYLPGVANVVLDLEDSVAERDEALALGNLQQVLRKMAQAIRHPGVNVYIRPRSYHQLAVLLTFEGIDLVRGFVIPKASVKGLPKYMEVLEQHPHEFGIMPVLEDGRMADHAYRMELREVLAEMRSRVLCCRLGGNDMFKAFDLRRNPEVSIYDTVVGHMIYNLLWEFRAGGPDFSFSFSAPVVDQFGRGHGRYFRHELVRDMANGLYGKTCIHPSQVRLAVHAYRPGWQAFVNSCRLLGLASGAPTPAVFGGDGQMHELTTHEGDALVMQQRARSCGVTYRPWRFGATRVLSYEAALAKVTTAV